MVSFEFEFDKPDKKYNAGETVACKITISVFSEFAARYLSVRFKGVAHTEWTVARTETSNVHKRTVYDRYCGDKEFFRSYQYMFGSENSRDTEVLVGTHTYNVAFKLPEILPSTFDHENGYIRYNIKAYYNLMQNIDTDATASFYVTSKIGLNEIPYALDPVKDIQENIFGFWCCKSDPMNFMNILPKRGYVIGETIPITIEVDNNSDVRIEFVRVKLIESLTFITKSPPDKRSETTTINEHFFQRAVEPFQRKRFQTTFYLDPNYLFKLLDGCGIITSEYHIKSEAESSGCHSNTDVSTRIFIGTLAYNEVTENDTIDSIEPIIVTSVTNPTAPTILNPTDVIVEQPLPSYSDVVSSGASFDRNNYNSGLRIPPGAPLASTEKIYLDDELPPPSFEESQRNSTAVSLHGSRDLENDEEDQNNETLMILS